MGYGTKCSKVRDYRTMQPPLLCLLVLVRLRSAARVANWNTSRTPSPVLAEHSRYSLAPILFLTAMPWDNVSNGEENDVRKTRLFGCHGSLVRFPQLLNKPGIASQILLTSDENDGEPATEVSYFRDPLKGCEPTYPDDVSSDEPFPERCPRNPGSRQRNR